MKLIRLDSHQCKYLLRRDLKQVRDSADFADCSTDLENWQQTVCFLGIFFSLHSGIWNDQKTSAQGADCTSWLMW